MRRVDSLTLGTINAGLRAPVSAEELESWLGSSADVSGNARANLALAAFFLELPLETQVEFLRLHGIPELQAVAIAQKLEVAAEFPLEARQRW